MVKGGISLLCIIFEFSKGAVWKVDFSRARLSSLWLWHCILKHISSDLHFLLHASHDLHHYHTHEHTMHHLFFPFSASIVLLSLAFFFPPISTLHLWFTILSMAIAFLFLLFEIVCAKALVGMCVWVQWFVCVQLAMYSDSLWDLRLHNY